MKYQIIQIAYPDPNSNSFLAIHTLRFKAAFGHSAKSNANDYFRHAKECWSMRNDHAPDNAKPIVVGRCSSLKVFLKHHKQLPTWSYWSGHGDIAEFGGEKLYY